MTVARARGPRGGEGAAITARGLGKRYGRIVAVDQVDLTVQLGDRYGYLGPNGAGKTTILRMLLGLVRPDAGEISLFGRPPARLEGRARRGVGVRRGANVLPVPHGARQPRGARPA